jgi:hypothetical protein
MLRNLLASEFHCIFNGLYFFIIFDVITNNINIKNINLPKSKTAEFSKKKN